jgi:hypothetical protein
MDASLSASVCRIRITGSKIRLFSFLKVGKSLITLDFGSEIWEDDTVTRLLSRLRDRMRDGWNGDGHRHNVERRPAFARVRYVITAAESAPCTCPDFCERDHENE